MFAVARGIPMSRHESVYGRSVFRSNNQSVICTVSSPSKTAAGLSPRVSVLKYWWAHLVSNQGPTGYEPVALPAELWALKCSCHYCEIECASCRKLSSEIIRCVPCRHQLSMKLFNFLLLLGCLSFLSAFASICRIRSLVTLKSRPTSSSV
jgi:hypothetical protein